ncbi:hypothetical protein LRP88_12193 [Fusarium phalaenopsidis]
MAIDWKPYEREVNHWYLDEGQTANEVIQLLLGKYNLAVTPRQFKAKFGGCKKVFALVDSSGRFDNPVTTSYVYRTHIDYHET